jgi:hypothetical protein
VALAVVPAVLIALKWSAVGGLLLPVIVSALPFVSPNLTILKVTTLISSILLFLFCLLLLVSAGIFFVPALVTMVLGCRHAWRRGSFLQTHSDVKREQLTRTGVRGTDA